MAYALILAFLYFYQRRLMYFPDTSRIAPSAAGFFRAHVRELKTRDDETLVTWFTAPSDGKPLIIYFHGNAGQIAGRARRFTALTSDGTGLLALSYRGYGGSSGAPTEDGLIKDAMAAYDHAIAAGIEPERMVLLGESLGSGVALALAARVKVAALILEAPFTSAADLAAVTYWMFPVRLLMHDQFRSDLRITQAKASLLIVHGTADGVIPIAFGEKLFARANDPKTFVRAQGEGHQPLDNPATMQIMRQWLQNILK